MDTPASPDHPSQPDAGPDLIELADKPRLPETGNPVDSSPDLFELVDKPLQIDGPVRLDGAPDVELIDSQRPALDVGLDAEIDSSPSDGVRIDATTLDGAVAGETRDHPCAACAANQVCVQNNDRICHTTAMCKTVSDACRTKLAASSAKSCASLSECESELCSQPYRCVYNIPCGNEIPEAAVYCYGP
jgi:hypothetical protein